VTVRPHGSVFSAAISAATNAIHAMLITPSANNAAISAQQQPTHHAPCFAPICSAPVRPSRHEPSRNPSGLRQCRRHTSLSGVSSYIAATTRIPPANHRPARFQASVSPNSRPPISEIPNASRPAAVQVSRYPHTKISGATGDRFFVICE